MNRVTEFKSTYKKGKFIPKYKISQIDFTTIVFRVGDKQITLTSEEKLYNNIIAVVKLISDQENDEINHTRNSKMSEVFKTDDTPQTS